MKRPQDEVIHSVPLPYHKGRIEVYSTRSGIYECRYLTADGVTFRDSGWSNQCYPNASIALRDALMVASGINPNAAHLFARDDEEYSLETLTEDYKAARRAA
jgi:hypothetical protein